MPKMATTAPSSSPSIKPNVVSKFNCVSNSSNSLIELGTTLSLIESSKCDQSAGDRSEQNSRESSHSEFKDSGEPTDEAPPSSGQLKLAMSSNGLTNSNSSFAETANLHLNKRELNMYLNAANGPCESTMSLDADQAGLYQKSKTTYLSANSCDIKIESDHYLNKKLRNGEFCVSSQIEQLDNELNNELNNELDQCADSNLANSLDNSPDNLDRRTKMANKSAGNPANSLAGGEPGSELDKLNNVNSRPPVDRTSDELIRDGQMNKRNRIKDNLIKCCDSADCAERPDADQTEASANDADQPSREGQQQCAAYRKESITEQMDTDNELFSATKPADQSSTEDRSLTEDEQMDISQCDRSKSVSATAANHHLYSKQPNDCPPDSNHLANGSYSSSLCSTPSELSTDVDLVPDLVYIESAGEQMDTSAASALIDLSKKSINELLVSDGEPVEVTSNKKQRNKDSKQDESSDNQTAIKEQSDNSSKDDNLSSSDNSDKSSNNNSSIRVPDDVSVARLINSVCY